MNSYLTPIGIRLSNLSLLIFLSGVLGAQCPGDVSWTMDPSPVNGQYQAGQTVNICAEIDDFNMTGFLLLGIVLDFPEAWDLSTVQVNTAPAACEENTGEWLYLEDILLPEIMAPGTGFFYDYYGANGDGDPLNDWGDGCGDASGNWSFCISVTLQSCGGSGNIVDDADITPSITLMNDNVIYDNPWAPPCNFTEHAFTESLTLNCCTAQSGGSPGILPICDYPIPLILELIPPYGTGGAWTDPSGSSFIGTFFPGENEPGDYTYTVAGTDGCMNSTTITLAYLNWGELQYSLYCQIEPVALSDLLTGVVLPSGGIWYDPNGYEVTNGIVDPSVDVSGVYTYVFENENSCTTTASLDLTFADDWAGTGALETTINICPDSPPFYLLDVLEPTTPGGEIFPNGSWIHTYLDSQNTFVAFYAQSEVLIDPADLEESSIFSYAVGFPGCTPSFVDLYVYVQFPSHTGEDTEAFVCFEDPAFQLEDLLDGDPEPGLTWTTGSGEVFPNLFDPSDYTPNTTLFLTYTGTETVFGCTSSSTLLLHITPSEAVAGDYTEIEVESTDLPFILTDSLSGSPQYGGVWTNSDGVIIALSLFIPGNMPYGLYTYTITSSCGSDTQQMLILEPSGLVDSEWGLSPLPENGQYEAGQQVEITVEFNLQLTGSGLLHGIILDMAPAWNVENYLSITPPETCGETGEWIFLESLENNGTTFGPGFYFDGPVNGPMDGDPTNNLGDACSTFNFSITLEIVEDCEAQEVIDLLPAIVLTSDGVTGSGNAASAETIVFGLDIPSLWMAPEVLDAGLDNEVEFLTDDLPFLLIDFLLGTPDEGGVWTDPNGELVSDGYFTPGVSVEGIYNYEVTGTCGSVSASLLVSMGDIEVSTGDGMNPDHAIQIFPNPVVDFAKIIIPNSLTGSANSYLHVYNVLGACVRSQKISAKELILDMDGMASGIYILNLSVGTEVPLTTKMIVVK